jgi:integrase
MYPEIKNSPNRERHIAAFGNILDKFGKDYPVKQLWVPQIKGYQIKRLKEGAKASTINKEKAALSKMFKVLRELKYVDVNPAHMVPYLSENSDKRHVYISFKDFQIIASAMPEWFRPIVLTAYYTGMRRGEILSMTRRKVNLTKRVIYLAPHDVKEKDWKRVPIHQELVPILEEVMSANVVGLDRLFLRNGNPVLHKNQVRWPWDEGMDQLPDFSPRPHFHDLRHTFKTNARRSHLNPEYVSAIMGHAGRAKSIDEGYGWISDEELVMAIDQLTCDHGDTVIWTSDAK